jgi:hypothetical protein
MQLTKEMVAGAISETVQAWSMPAEKADLPQGPWQYEPDKIQWVDQATGLPCLIVRNHLGALCGYAGVTPGHPFYRKRHDEDDVELQCRREINYSAACDHARHPWQGICHIPEPGATDDVWWFGFDCMRCFDLVPAFISRSPVDRFFEQRMRLGYRDVTWVARAVTEFAAQLHQRGQAAM